jgi:hypothetical protein
MLGNEPTKLVEWRTIVGADFACGSLVEATAICVREATQSEERNLPSPAPRVVPIREGVAAEETKEQLLPRRCRKTLLRGLRDLGATHVGPSKRTLGGCAWATSAISCFDHQELASQARRFVADDGGSLALGKDLWGSADDFSRMCGVQSATAARFYAQRKRRAKARQCCARALNE